MNKKGIKTVEFDGSTAWPDWWQGPVMFYLSLLFLALLAALLVLWIDVPRVVETGEMIGADDGADWFPELSPQEIEFEAKSYAWGNRCGQLLLFIWPLFVAEQLYYRFRSPSGATFRAKHPNWFIFCLLPPLRLCAHRRGACEQIWLPSLGFQTVDRKLRKRLERSFSIPMVWIAFLILPVLALQLIFKEKIADYASLRLMLHLGTGLIWFAFAVEFIVMASVASNKLDYCKKHWLDLVIIILPLISFLRTLRIMRAAKLVKLGKLQQLSRVVRAYRLRGVVMRALRALLVLEVVHRLLRTKPEARLRKLEYQYTEKKHELEELAEKILALKTKLGCEPLSSVDDLRSAPQETD